MRMARYAETPIRRSVSPLSLRDEVMTSDDSHVILWRMNEGGQDPQSFTAARRALEEYLRQASPETWRVLEDPGVGFTQMPEAIVFSFVSDDEDVFERITMAKSLEILKGAARAARFNVRLRCGSKEISVDAG
jgi:hypothetical protein